MDVGWDLAEWLKRLTASRNSPGFDPSILRLSEILGAADEAVGKESTIKNQKKFAEKIICLHKKRINLRLLKLSISNLSKLPGNVIRKKFMLLRQMN